MQSPAAIGTWLNDTWPGISARVQTEKAEIHWADETAVQDWLAENADRKLSRLAKRAERFLTETSLIDDLQAEPPIAWLGEIACPTYAMYGSESDILDRARELEAKVSSCELEIVPDCSHSLLTEQSALVRERALAWIQRVG